MPSLIDFKTMSEDYIHEYVRLFGSGLQNKLETDLTKYQEFAQRWEGVIRHTLDSLQIGDIFTIDTPAKVYVLYALADATKCKLEHRMY